MAKKAAKPIKSEDTRRHEVQLMKDKMYSLGLTTEMIAVKDVIARLDEFAIHGHPESFKVKLPGLKRIAEVNLCSRPSNESQMLLRYAEHV